MLPNDNVSMSIGHLDHVLIVYSSKEFNFVASVYGALHSPYLSTQQDTISQTLSSRQSFIFKD